MSLTFPLTRQCLGGWVVSNPDCVNRTQFSDGKVQVYPKFTKVYRTIDNVVWKYISNDDANNMKEFYESTTSHGSLAFDLTLYGNRENQVFDNVMFSAPPKYTRLHYNKWLLECSFVES